MVDVLTLLRTREPVSRISRAIRMASWSGHWSFSRREAGSWQELWEQLARSPSALAVIDPYYSGGFDLAEVTKTCGLAQVSGCVAYGDFRGRPAQDAIKVARGGAARVVTFNADDDPAALIDILRRTTGAGALKPVVEACEGGLTPSQGMILRWSVKHGVRPRSVGEMASTLSIPGRTLRRRCEDLDDLTPKRFLQWGRLLQAARLVTCTDMPIVDIARALGFASAPDLERAFTALAGVDLSRVERSEVLGLTGRALKGRYRSQPLTNQ